MTIQEYIKKKDITLYGLAKELGYSKTYLYQIEAGKKPMTAKLAKKLYNYTNGEIEINKPPIL